MSNTFCRLPETQRLFSKYIQTTGDFTPGTMSNYGGPSGLEHMNPALRRAMGINELVGAAAMVTPPATNSMRNTTAGKNRPVLGSGLSGETLEEKIQPIVRKRRGGSRRACNECKQQKVRLYLRKTSKYRLSYTWIGEQLRCDIVQTPSSSACSRCKRLSIDCKVEPSFQRISKRRWVYNDSKVAIACQLIPDDRRNAEMEREIADLRRRLTDGEHPQPAFDANAADEMNQSAEDVFYDPHSPPPSTRAQSMSEQQSSPLRRPLAPPGPSESMLPRTGNTWTLEEITLSRPRIARLFEQ